MDLDRWSYHHKCTCLYVHAYAPECTRLCVHTRDHPCHAQMPGVGQLQVELESLHVSVAMMIHFLPLQTVGDGCSLHSDEYCANI